MTSSLPRSPTRRFVDREKEMARLQQLLKADSPSFIIIRGRRRIGESTLIGKMLGEKDIYYEADRTDPANQMAGLSRMVAIDYKKNVAGKFVLVEVASMVTVTPSSCA